MILIPILTTICIMISKQKVHITLKVSSYISKTQNVNGFSIIHFNSRSIKTGFNEITDNLKELNRMFDLICFSESWLTDSDNISDYDIENYNCVCMNRKTK